MTGVRAVPATGFVGRSAEALAIAKLLAAAESSEGGALVVHGDAGIGKTAVVEHALARVPEALVLRAVGAEFEMELAYAGLHQLCAGTALEPALRVADHARPDPFVVGLAVLGLLSEASTSQPVVCFIDDAQWIDDASMRAIAFAARRVEAERVAFVFALREPESVDHLRAFPHLPVAPLDDAEAREVLDEILGGLVDDAVCQRIVAEAHGNPLALHEFAAGRDAVTLAGGFREPVGSPLTGALERSFARRIEELGPEPRALVLLAAAEPLGDLDLLRASAAALGVDWEQIEAAETAGLVRLGRRVRFRHPLVRSAAYRSAPPAELRRVHAALAEATPATSDPDRRAWHRACAAHGPNDAIADELVRSADRARDRGGLAAACAFLQRAAELATDEARHGSLMVTAATLTLQAGAPTAAAEMLDEAEAARLDEDTQARARLARARISFHVRRDAQATLSLLDAADALEPDAARETYLEAFASAMYLEEIPGGLRGLARSIASRAPTRTHPRPVDQLLDALVHQALEEPAVAVRSMREALRSFRKDTSEDRWWLDLASQMAIDLHDGETLTVLADRQVKLSRREGDLSLLPRALNMQALARLTRGGPAEAAASITEALAVESATGSVGLAFGERVLAAWRGDEARLDEILTALRARAGRMEVSAELYARTVLNTGLGRYDAALEAGRQAIERERGGAYVVWQIGPEVIEAAVRGGDRDLAAEVLRTVVARLRASGTDLAIGIELQSRALVAADADADALYVAAADRLSRSGETARLARLRLLYGEWLRRRQRRTEARAQLSQAHAALSAMGLDGFAARAAHELQATGGSPRKRDVNAIDALTPQELHIARLVAAGATSKEVAQELFLSPRTVDAHLRNIFRKLDISSRKQLRGMPL